MSVDINSKPREEEPVLFPSIYESTTDVETLIRKNRRTRIGPVNAGLTMLGNNTILKIETRKEASPQRPINTEDKKIEKVRRRN